MLRSLLSLKRYRVFSRDGEIGFSSDYLFDQETWLTRYVVVRKGAWFPAVETPIPLSADPVEVDTSEATIALPLTNQQIHSSPSINAAEPVSRRKERELYLHYGYPAYWTMGHPSADGLRSRVEAAVIGSQSDGPYSKDGNESYLRSLNKIVGYRIEATDDTFGHIEDLVVETDTWNVRYMVIDVQNWVPSKQVLVAPDWTVRFD